TAPDAVGRNRLTKMIYPSQVGLPAREVNLVYGASGSDDDRLSRVSALTTNLGLSSIAQFSYIGNSRRARMELAAGWVTTDLGLDATGLSGLDGFGRVKDLHTRAGPTSGYATLFRAQYGYNAAGHRVTARLTQADEPGVSGDNSRSQVNAYNALGQLVQSQVGSLDSS